MGVFSRIISKLFNNTLIVNCRNVVILKTENIKPQTQAMDDLKKFMSNSSLKHSQFRGALLKYFNHTGEVKLPAIW